MAMNDVAAAARKQELLARAETLVPVLRGRAGKAESLRRCPEETVADFADAGLLRICQPARFGGYEQPWDVLCEVSRVLAHGCGSQAWVENIYCDHTQMLGMFPLEAQADVWGKDEGGSRPRSSPRARRGRRRAAAISCRAGTAMRVASITRIGSCAARCSSRTESRRGAASISCPGATSR